ncbi:MAG TPA: fused MFS/spermidine synthase [Terracidiphilus sp.]|nr:fused MFS/spermidine synthase [Terracidiphilus sp.]
MARTRPLFGSAVFQASFLLFLVEPIAAKQLLPFLGGSAAVWITCLVFFQTALLLAYLYAHWLARHPRWGLHLLLLAAALALAFFWALGGLDLSRGSEHPVFTIFSALSLWIGLPFLALGATSPLLQVWWSRVEQTAIPYRLFALSNLASLLALAAYPTLVEPYSTLRAQRIAWTCGFAAFALVAAALTRRTRAAALSSTTRIAETEETAPRAPLQHKLLWLLLPMGASMQLSAVTSYITANIAPIPLLWILPLAVYLISIILAFEFPRLFPRGILTRFLAVMLAALGYMLSQVDVTVPIRIGIGFFLFELLAACLFCHTEAYALRPQRASESTVFYLLFAAGGALGSFLVGIACPLLFSFNYDLAITFAVTALLALAAIWNTNWGQRLLWSAASIMMCVLVFWLHTAYQHDTTVAVRNFYGALRVKQNFGFPGATLRTLTNGTIQHGTQIFGTDEQRKTPTTYYAPDSGAGLALRFCCQSHTRNIGVIGLGAGTLAAYGQPGDHIHFYEIDPAIEPIARHAFTYIRESGAQIDVVPGDARTSLTREQPQHFDVLAVDAFSGDAIPLHLLTREALALYRKHLAPGGILAFHISNQHVDLEPAIALLAQDAGLRAVRITSLAKEDRGEFTANWVLVSDNAAFFAQPEVASAALPPSFRPGLRLWTDDYSSLLPLLRW